MSGLESSRGIKFYPWLAKRTSVNAAIMAQQIYYWQCREGGGRIHEGQRWVYNTYEQWAEQTGLSPQQAKDAIKLLEDIGALRSEQLDKSSYKRVKFYRIEAGHEVFNDPGEAPATPEETESNGAQDAVERVYRPDRAAPQTRSSLNQTKTTSETSKQEALAPFRKVYLELLGMLAEHCSKQGLPQPGKAETESLHVLEQISRLDLIPPDKLPALLAWALSDQFYQDKLLSISRWRRRWDSGLTAIASAYQGWQKALNGGNRNGSAKPQYSDDNPPPGSTAWWAKRQREIEAGIRDAEGNLIGGKE